MKAKYCSDYRYGVRTDSNVPVTIVGSQNRRFRGRVCNFSNRCIYVTCSDIVFESSTRIEIEINRLHDRMPRKLYGHIVRVDNNGAAVMLDDALMETSSIQDMLWEYNQLRTILAINA